VEGSTETVTWLQAWWHWWHPTAGMALGDLILWGYRILWWGRLGKLMEFMAGMLVVVDVVGPTRLKAFGDSMHSWFDTRATFEKVRRLVAWRNDSVSNDLKVTGLFCFLIIAIAASVISNNGAFAYFAVGLFLYLFSAVFIALGGLLAFVSGWLLDSILIEPMAWILRHSDAERWVKALSAILILVGFHFDLLAS
jgi:hypothetical protein